MVDSLRRLAASVVVLSAAVQIPSANAAPGSCGFYTTTQGDFALVVQSGSATCQEARSVFDHNFAGAGTPIARNAVLVDGYECVGNPAGAFSETGILSYCEGNGNRIELRKP